MDIELGIQNVARTVTFSTEQSADEVNNVIAEAVASWCRPVLSAMPSSVPKPSTPSASAISDRHQQTRWTRSI